MKSEPPVGYNDRVPTDTQEPENNSGAARLGVLEAGETALRSLIENAQGFAVYRIAFDPEHPYGGRLVFVSPSIREIVGVEEPDRFESWFERLHPDDAERVLAANGRSIAHGEPYNQTARVFHPGKGQWVWVHTISNPVFDAQGQLTHFDGLVLDLSDQMNLREAERLRAAAEGLREILGMINSNRPLQEILDTIARQANGLLGASSTMIRHVSLEEDRVRTVASYNLPAEFEAVRSQPFYRSQTDQAMLEGRPVVVADVPTAYLPRLADPNLTDPLQRAGLEATVRHYRSFLKTPLFIRGSIYGAVTFHYEQPRSFSEEDLRLAMALANQAALAIDNARLIDRVKETAVLEERNRLARDLHDAVTQTLFSSTLIAEVLPRIWDRDSGEGRKRLEELRELTRGALAEMRTLLMELRPAALADAPLKDLLRHLTNALIARARVPVELEIDGAGEPPLEVKVACYRIAQEALNNIAKHSDAGQVTVRLDCRPDGVELIVTDDGQGFDPAQVPPGRLGLGILRERAAGVGAKIEITSGVGRGTRIRLRWRSEED